jgi:hypothetical protein
MEYYNVTLPYIFITYKTYKNLSISVYSYATHYLKVILPLTHGTYLQYLYTLMHSITSVQGIPSHGHSGLSQVCLNFVL